MAVDRGSSSRRLAVCVMLALLTFTSACSDGRSDNRAQSGTVPPAPTKSIMNDQGEGMPDADVWGRTIEVTIANTFDPPKEDGNFVQTYLEQKFNVKFKNIKYDRQTWRDQINVLLASGDIPDIFPGDAIDADMVAWAKQGIIASIPEEEIRQYMPRYVADFESVEPNAWIVGRFEGKNWGIPRVWINGATGFLPAYNSDWLEAIGYAEPPGTLEELEDVLTQFAFNDPDGNGKDDTFGMTARAKDATNQMFNSVFSAFGVNPYQYAIGQDGSLIYSGLSEETRAALKLLNEWYKKGIIDPEFVTDGNGKIADKFANGRIGMFDTGMWHHLYDDGTFGQAALSQNRKITVGAPIVGPTGEGLSYSNGALQAPMLLGAQLEHDDEKRIRILQMLEYMATDEEGYLKTAYGEEGVSYTFDGEVAVWTEDYSTFEQRTELGIGGFYNGLNGRVNAMEKFALSPEKLAFRNKYTGGVRTFTDALGPAVLESKPQYDEMLRSMQDLFFIKAITGEVDTNKGFDDFVHQWLETGGREMLEEANRLYRERGE